MKLRHSAPTMTWEDILSGEEIFQWVFHRKKHTRRPFELSKESGVYRWLFPAIDLGKPTAYIGEAEDLNDRLAEYLNSGNRQAHCPGDLDACNSDSGTERYRTALKENHRDSTIRIGAELRRKSESRRVKLQVLRIIEDISFPGFTVSAELLNDKIGRVFIEHLLILKTENEGYRMLNRNPSTISKMLREKLPASLGGTGHYDIQLAMDVHVVSPKN